MTASRGALLRLVGSQRRWIETHIALRKPMCYMAKMVPDKTSLACPLAAPIVIDDRCRLPGRFFGRFATSATSELTRAI
jgi:hypothetical protein